MLHWRPFPVFALCTSLTLTWVPTLARCPFLLASCFRIVSFISWLLVARPPFMSCLIVMLPIVALASVSFLPHDFLHCIFLVSHCNIRAVPTFCTHFAALRWWAGCRLCWRGCRHCSQTVAPAGCLRCGLSAVGPPPSPRGCRHCSQTVAPSAASEPPTASGLGRGCRHCSQTVAPYGRRGAGFLLMVGSDLIDGVSRFFRRFLLVVSFQLFPACP